MTTSRFLRAPIRTVTITGTTSVGGVTNTVIAIYPDSTLRFTDANGVKQVVPLPTRYTTAATNTVQPSSNVTANGNAADQLYALFDAIARRV